MGCWLAKGRSFGRVTPNCAKFGPWQWRRQAHGELDALISSPWVPESGVAASEVVSPESSKRDAVGKIFGVEYFGKLKEPRKSITSGGSYQHCNGQKNLHFADDAPKHFQQPDRSLHPTVALQMSDWQWRSTLFTDKASWNQIDRHWQTHALREPSGNQAEVRSPNHMNLYKLCAGCKLGVTWVAHTPPHALLHQL